MPVDPFSLTYPERYIQLREANAKFSGEPLSLNPLHSEEYTQDMLRASLRMDPRSEDDKRKGVTIRKWWKRWRSGAYSKAGVVRRGIQQYLSVSLRYENRDWFADTWGRGLYSLSQGKKLPRTRSIRDVASLICNDLRIWLSDIEDDLFE